MYLHVNFIPTRQLYYIYYIYYIYYRLFDIIPIMRCYICIIQINFTDLCTHVAKRKISIVTLHIMGMPRLVKLPCLMECHVSWKWLFPWETWVFNTWNIVYCHAWRNEVIIEWYRRFTLNLVWLIGATASFFNESNSSFKSLDSLSVTYDLNPISCRHTYVADDSPEDSLL